MDTSSNSKLQHYPFYFVMRCHEDAADVLLYRFKSTRSHQCYLVRVEIFPHHFYGVKFYLKAHQHSKDKYTMLTGLNEARAVINTCIAVTIDVSKRDPRSSFGFIGSNMSFESEKNTKRFRVYRAIVSTFFSEEQFYHFQIEEKSTYALIRRTEIDGNPQLLDALNTYFSDNYDYFS